jgi:RND family efflux transporter MFP subunit
MGIGMNTLWHAQLSRLPAALAAAWTNFRKGNGAMLHTRSRWWLLAIPVVLISGGLALHFVRLHQADSSPPPEQAPWALQTAKVERGSVAGSIQSIAVIDAPQVITISPQIQGTVLAVGPRAGVAVKRGDLLVRIDSRTIANNLSALQQQYRAAQASADYAEKQQTRFDALLTANAISKTQADLARSTAQATRAQAQALSEQVAALRVNLGYAEIRAPQDAVIAERAVEVGYTVAPGNQVYKLTAGKGAVVRVVLSAPELAHVRVGDMLELTQNAAIVRLPVTRVAPAVNAAGLGTVEADAPAAPFGLPSGSSVAATVLSTSTSKTLTVPVSALVGTGLNAHVVVFAPGAKSDAPGHLRLVRIEVLQQGSQRAAIRGAVKPGEQVVVGQTATLAQLRDGDAAIASASTDMVQ